MILGWNQDDERLNQYEIKMIIIWNQDYIKMKLR